MRNLFLVSLYLFLAASSFAELTPDQLHKIDSLNDVLKNKNSHDTSRASAYVVMSELLYIGNIDTMISLCDKAKDIAIEGLKNDLEPSVVISLKGSLSAALNNTGYVYWVKGEIEKALEYYLKSLTLGEELGNDDVRAHTMNNIAYVFFVQGKIEKSLEYYHRSLKIREEQKDEKGMATAFNNIGLVYLKQDELEIAAEYYSKALNKYESIKSKHGMGYCLNNLGHLFWSKNENDKALEYYDKSLALREEINDRVGVAEVLNNIGSVYKNKGDLERAKAYYLRAIKMQEDLNNLKGLTLSLSNLGALELERGNIVESLTYLTRGLSIAQEIGTPRFIADNSISLSKLYKLKGEYQKALDMYVLHIQMRDSIKNTETQKATIRQQTKYEFEKVQLIQEQQKKDAQRIIEEETTRRDNLQYSIILITLLLVFGGVLSLGFIKVSPKVAEGLIFFSFLILFEFMLVLADPYIDKFSSGAPGYKLLFNAGLAGLIFPLHNYFEVMLKSKLTRNAKK